MDGTYHFKYPCFRFWISCFMNDQMVRKITSGFQKLITRAGTRLAVVRSLGCSTFLGDVSDHSPGKKIQLGFCVA